MSSAKDLYRTGVMSAERWGSKKATLRIEMCEPDTIKTRAGIESTKLVLEFEGGDLRIALNKTNAMTLIKAFGDDYNEWVGKKVIITTAPVEFNGERTRGLVVTPVKK